MTGAAGHDKDIMQELLSGTFPQVVALYTAYLAVDNILCSRP